MKTVERYLDDMFRNLPQTVEVQQEKQRMLLAARREYDQLIQVGVAPQTAVTRIMNGLRSVEHQAYGTTEKQPVRYDTTDPLVDERMAKDIIAAGKVNALLKAGGVGAIIAGAALTDLTDMIGSYFLGGFLSEMVESLGGLFFLVVLTFAILGFVKSKKKKHQFDFLNKGSVLTRGGVRTLEEYMGRGFDLQKSLIVGILLCVFGFGISSVFESLPMAWFDALADMLMMTMEAAGVFVLVYRGQIKKLMDQIRNLLMRGNRSDME